MSNLRLAVPRCLNVDETYVGAPRLRATDGQKAAWSPSSYRGGTASFRQRAMQECFDTVAVLRAYREPLENETWMLPGKSERRLLAQVHAIVALGRDALEQVAANAIDPDLPDPAKVFAALFVLGCVQGRTFSQALQQIFLAAVLRHPGERTAAVEALSLAPNREMRTWLEFLLSSDERPRVRAAAVRVLAYRCSLGERAWRTALGDSEMSVVAAAAAAPIHNYDRADCARVLQPLIEHDNDEILRPALIAGLGLRLAAARSRAAEIVSSGAPRAGAETCLAMFGFLDDARLIGSLLHGAPLTLGVRAAATLGSLELVPHLLSLFDRHDLTPEQVLEVQAALERITGLRFESMDSPVQMQKQWELRSSDFDFTARHRGGIPIDTHSLLQELKAPCGSRLQRHGAFVELMAATESRAPHFSVHDFVGEQTYAIDSIQRWLDRSPQRRSPSQALY